MNEMEDGVMEEDWRVIHCITKLGLVQCEEYCHLTSPI